jgi:hypothetical protein
VIEQEKESQKSERDLWSLVVIGSRKERVTGQNYLFRLKIPLVLLVLLLFYRKHRVLYISPSFRGE